MQQYNLNKKNKQMKAVFDLKFLGARINDSKEEIA